MVLNLIQSANWRGSQRRTQKRIQIPWTERCSARGPAGNFCRVHEDLQESSCQPWLSARLPDTYPSTWFLETYTCCAAPRGQTQLITEAAQRRARLSLTFSNLGKWKHSLVKWGAAAGCGGEGKPHSYWPVAGFQSEAEPGCIGESQHKGKDKSLIGVIPYVYFTHTIFSHVKV